MSKPAASFQPLTAREKEILRMKREGFQDKEIARALHVARTTISNGNTRILQKLGVRDSHNAVLVDFVMEQYLGET